MRIAMDPTRAKDLIVGAAGTDPSFLSMITAPTAEQFSALSTLVGSTDPAPEIVTGRLDLSAGAPWTEVAKSILVGPVLWRTLSAPAVDARDRDEVCDPLDLGSSWVADGARSGIRREDDLALVLRSGQEA